VPGRYVEYPTYLRVRRPPVDLINDVLDMSRSRPEFELIREDFDSRDPISGAFASYACSRRGRGQLRGASAHPALNARPPCAQQILLNLVSNRFKFTPRAARWWSPLIGHGDDMELTVATPAWASPSRIWPRSAGPTSRSAQRQENHAPPWPIAGAGLRRTARRLMTIESRLGAGTAVTCDAGVIETPPLELGQRGRLLAPTLSASALSQLRKASPAAKSPTSTNACARRPPCGPWKANSMAMDSRDQASDACGLGGKAEAWRPDPARGHLRIEPCGLGQIGAGGEPGRHAGGQRQLPWRRQTAFEIGCSGPGRITNISRAVYGWLRR